MQPGEPAESIWIDMSWRIIPAVHSFDFVIVSVLEAGRSAEPAVAALFSFVHRPCLESFGLQPIATVCLVWVPLFLVGVSRSEPWVLVMVCRSGCSRCRYLRRCVVLLIVMTAGLGRMFVCALP